MALSIVICMNTFLARREKARPNSRDGNRSPERADWLSFFSRALCLTGAAPATTMHLINITTGTGTDTSEVKPWIVRVVRVVRVRRPRLKRLVAH
ncbi:MAG: hypothetical protein QOJ05_1780 [Verrucomicrobiota bacterium]|jgi:hypothetical protein